MYNNYKCNFLKNDIMSNNGIEKQRRAVSFISGGPLAPDINGIVVFTDVPGGAEVSVEIFGLPLYSPAVNGSGPMGPLGFHIHENGTCDEGSADDPFTAAGAHWNPDNQPHGNHAGDFPNLFSNGGYSRLVFFTERFKVADIIGKSIIIHQNPDDSRTQPSGNSGKRLACGLIREIVLQ